MYRHFLALFRACKTPSGWTTCWQHKKLPWIWKIHFKVFVSVLPAVHVLFMFQQHWSDPWPFAALFFLIICPYSSFKRLILSVEGRLSVWGYGVHVAVYMSRRSYRQSALRRHLVALSLKRSLYLSLLLVPPGDTLFFSLMSCFASCKINIYRALTVNWISHTLPRSEQETCQNRS